MRNLVLCGSVRVGDAPELSHAQHVCVDYDTKDVYVVTASAIFTIAFPSQEVSGDGAPHMEALHQRVQKGSERN